MEAINTALVGFGSSARIYNAPFIHANPRFNLTKVVERHHKHSKEVYPYVQVVRSLDELLEDPSVQLVVITTPNTLHYPQAKQALEAGKHVIVEKPFTINSKEADELIDLAHSKGLLLSVFQNRRWDGDFLTVKEIIKKGFLGRLVEFESHFEVFRNYLRPGAWREEPEPGSGVLYDLGPHLIDQALVLFGLPKEITAFIEIQRDNAQTNDRFKLMMHYENLRVTLMAGLLAREAGPRYLLHGTQGSFIKYGLDPQEEALKQGKSPLEPDWGVESSDRWGKLNSTLQGLHVESKIETQVGNHQGYYDDIYDAIINKREPAVKPVHARNIIRVIELALESSKRKCTVEFLE